MALTGDIWSKATVGVVIDAVLAMLCGSFFLGLLAPKMQGTYLTSLSQSHPYSPLLTAITRTRGGAAAKLHETIEHIVNQLLPHRPQTRSGFYRARARKPVLT